MKRTMLRRAGVGAALFLALGASTMGATVHAQGGDPTAQPADTQPAQQNNDGFPWGLLGLAGLAGLAGLRRREEPQRVQTIDASRRNA